MDIITFFMIREVRIGIMTNKRREKIKQETYRKVFFLR